MSKKQMEGYLIHATDALKTAGIVDEDNEADGIFRRYISSFAAAITMGSPASAVLFFAKQDSAKEDRALLMKAIYYLLYGGKRGDGKSPYEAIEGAEALLFEKTVKQLGGGEREMHEKLLDAATALKLALNLYIKEDDKKDKGKAEQQGEEAQQDKDGGAS